MPQKKDLTCAGFGAGSQDATSPKARLKLVLTVGPKTYESTVGPDLLEGKSSAEIVEIVRQRANTLVSEAGL